MGGRRACSDEPTSDGTRTHMRCVTPPTALRYRYSTVSWDYRVDYRGQCQLAKVSQVKSSQVKSSQVKSSQVKSSQYLT